MLSIADAHSNVLPGALAAPGGFAWWYADLLDEDGNGIVLIPSFGLPFLPGLASASRRGDAPAASARPALALSVYEHGRPVYYLLQEVAPHEAVQEGHTVRIGDSTFRFAPGSLEAHLDLSAPGGRLVGTVRAEGVPRRALACSPLEHPDHEWSPLVGPARGTWDLTVGGQRFAGAGSAYLDRNAGRADLASLGLSRWTWCRTQLPDRLRIGYALWPEQSDEQAVIVDVHADGRTEAHPAVVRQGEVRRNLWGLRWWPALRLEAGERSMTIEVTHRPDDGPFYQRSLAQVHTEVGTAIGLGEVCEVDRIDQGWMRPLVAMCLHRPQGPNSAWLPLFAGPRRGRLARLLGAA